jgi:hypothetical protein
MPCPCERYLDHFANGHQRQARLIRSSALDVLAPNILPPSSNPACSSRSMNLDRKPVGMSVPPRITAE